MATPPARGLAAIVAARAGLVRDRESPTPLDEDLQSLVDALRSRFEDAMVAVLLYGSYTRGARDSLVDLYVLTDGPVANEVLPPWQRWANRCLAPNVYQLESETGVRCKYALLPLKAFLYHLRRDFHPYFWARFAQPCRALHLANSEVATDLTRGLADAVRRLLREGRRGLPRATPAPDLWPHVLGHTYRCELRAEGGTRAGHLYEANRAYFTELAQAWREECMALESWPQGLVAPLPGAWRWPVRRVLGKGLSAARLLKAAFTFNDGFDYLLWKIERHSGVYVQPTPRQRRWPLLFAWPLLWRLYRLGAFR